MFACTGNEKGTTIDSSPVVAHLDNNGVVVCDLTLVRDTVDLPLSAFCSDFEIIRLDNSDDAIVGDGSVWISDNYLGIFSYEAGAYKLFDRKGKFIKDICKRGQGPNEFLYGIYDSYIDETEEKIYIFSGMASKIMVFDLQGNPLEPIPLPFMGHKVKMKINVREQTVVLLALPFENTPYVVWKQDFKGNVIQSIPAGQFTIIPNDYSNEVDALFNSDAIDYYLFRWGPKVDSLYHYDENSNILIPKFTAHFPNEAPSHSFEELPDYYTVRLYSDKFASSPPLRDILIDKQTLKGAHVRYKLDFLGNMDGHLFIWFNRGYAIANTHPADFKERIEAALEQENLTTEMRQKLTELNGSISDDDNNIVLIAKLKQ
ncbi:MAG: 6-bladed beta-propeller [Tannerella sp.]|jgi:hypothetical protein|nr:6-bladed beta-propeller [Tannerella sp.]